MKPYRDTRAPETRAPRQDGFFLLESMLALAVCAAAVLGVLALVPTTLALHRAASEHAEARNAAQARVAELQVLDLQAFRDVFTPEVEGGPLPGQDLLSLGVDALPLADGDETHGQVTISPDPAEEAEAFAAATSFDVLIVVRWRSVGGTQTARFAIKLTPEQPFEDEEPGEVEL